MQLAQLTFLFLFLSFAQVFADTIKLTCTYGKGVGETSSATFNEEREVFVWNQRPWEIVFTNEDVLTAQQVISGHWPKQWRRLSSVLIDRKTGKFWLTDLGGFCVDDDCNTVTNGGRLIEGQCFRDF